MKKSGKKYVILPDYNKKYDDAVISDPEENLYNDPLQNDDFVSNPIKNKFKSVKKDENGEF